jgi:hypothetical protein
MEEEAWFRLREDYVYLACSERFLRQLSEKWRQAKATPSLRVPDAGKSQGRWSAFGDINVQ